VHLNFFFPRKKSAVASRVQCPRCGSFKSWILKRGGRRCANCRFDWRPERWPLRLTAREWRRLLQWFVRGAPSAAIAREAHLDRKRVLRALAVVRQRIAEEAPPGVRHAQETHEIEHPPAEAAAETMPATPPVWPPPKRPSRRSAVLGLYADQGMVWADVVPAHEAEALRSQLRRPPHHVVPNGSSRYAALVYRGRLHRVGPAAPTDVAAQPFGLVASFWSYLQRQLRTKGGIRLERLDLYLAEWAWRYNHRRLSAPEQLRELLILTRRAGRRSGTLPHPHAGGRAGDARDRTHRLHS